MDIALRRTPCVGICSTTYGDLVCRGCKRFAHEISGWNGYTADQRARVWHRLEDLRDAATRAHVAICDAQKLAAAARTLQLANDATQMTCAYELLRRKSRSIATLGDVGLAAVADANADAVALRDRVDAEYLRRSVAVYERSFHVVVDG